MIADQLLEYFSCLTEKLPGQGGIQIRMDVIIIIYFRSVDKHLHFAESCLVFRSAGMGQFLQLILCT